MSARLRTANARELRIQPQARKACTLLLDSGLQPDGGINYGWRGRSETCITGMVLSILAYFEVDDGRLDTTILAPHFALSRS